MTPRLLTFDDAATVLRVGVSTVKRLVKAGELHPVKVLGASRLPATDLDAYVERITTEPTPSTLSEGA